MKPLTETTGYGRVPQKTSKRHPEASYEAFSYQPDDARYRENIKDSLYQSDLVKRHWKAIENRLRSVYNGPISTSKKHGTE